MKIGLFGFLVSYFCITNLARSQDVDVGVQVDTSKKIKSSNWSLRRKHGSNNETKIENREKYMHFEKLGELYYQSQKVEREKKRQWAHEFHILTGNYPCVRGVNPIGLSTAASIEDGHKFGCGIPSISGSPIVYSFGSHRQQDFETAMLQIRPDSSIFTFELVADMLPAMEDRLHGVSFFNIGLGYSQTPAGAFKTFAQIMHMLNHSYVDVVKMDVEGYEWHWIQK